MQSYFRLGHFRPRSFSLGQDKSCSVMLGHLWSRLVSLCNFRSGCLVSRGDAML
jgi:hypothetical protein